MRSPSSMEYVCASGMLDNFWGFRRDEGLGTGERRKAISAPRAIVLHCYEWACLRIKTSLVGPNFCFVDVLYPSCQFSFLANHFMIHRYACGV